jgi:hypothetical protein
MSFTATTSTEKQLVSFGEEITDLTTEEMVQPPV